MIKIFVPVGMFFTPLFKMIPSLFKKQKIWIFKNLEIMILDINKISIKRLEIEKPVINNLIFKKPDFIKLSVTDDPVTPVNLEQLRPSLLERPRPSLQGHIKSDFTLGVPSFQF